MYLLAALLAFPFAFMLALALLVAIGDAIVKWFNSPSDRKERAYLSARLRGDWR